MSAPVAADEQVGPVVTDVVGLPSLSYEVAVEFLQLTDPAGHQRWLTHGDELPPWVTAEQRANLLRSGGVFEFRRI